MDTLVIFAAARRGQLSSIQWWLAKYPNPPFFLDPAWPRSCVNLTMDYAARAGRLEVVKWLHEHRSEGCTTRAMDWAAGDGHFHVVKWLHENRSEGCTTKAMDAAAANGHLCVVRWLHTNRTEGCTAAAMDEAARNGNLEVVMYLHENRTEGCTVKAVDLSDWDIISWLLRNRSEGCSIVAWQVQNDLIHDYNRTVKNLEVLHFHQQHGVNDRAAEIAAASGHLPVLQWFYEHYREFFNFRLVRRSGAKHLHITTWLDALSQIEE